MSRAPERGRLIVGVAALAGSLLVPGAAAAGSGAGAPKAAPALVLNYTFAAESGTTVRDRSGSGAHGTLVNASAPTAYTTSLAGHAKALRLTGAQHQFVDVGDPAALDVDRYTLAAWVRYTGVPNDQTLGRWEVLEKANAYWLNIRTDGRIRAGGFYGGCANPHWQYLDSPQAVPTGTWTHVASTYNGAQLAIWVDGVKVVSRAITGTTCANAEPLAVGAKNAPAKGLLEAFYDGDLDDVRVYSKAITAAQIAALAAR